MEDHIQIATPPPPSVFGGEVFSVVFLCPSACRIVANPSSGFQVHQQETDHSTVTIHCSIQKTTTLTIQSDSHEIQTSSIMVVLRKIQVKCHEWTPIWYKDEGGRDKCIEIHASLHDATGTILYKPIPLKVSVVYANFRSVVQQELLRLLGSEPVVSESTGVAKVRFRIEDVSKNHQGQDFRVKLSHDDTCGPGYTPPVTVRSKRNKKRSRGSFDPRLKAAVRGLSAWTHHTVGLLYQLQSIPQNPGNDRAIQLLSAYRENAEHQLKMLCESIDPNGKSSFQRHRNRDHPTSMGVVPPPKIARKKPFVEPHHADAATKVPPFAGRPCLPIVPYPRPSHRRVRSAPAPAVRLPAGNLESRVEYMLSQQFKSITNNQRLGYPCYDENKHLLGFYLQSKNRYKFVPTDFGSLQKEQASEILKAAAPESVQTKSEHGSLSSMLNHALVYEWSKDVAKSSP